MTALSFLRNVRSDTVNQGSLVSIDYGLDDLGFDPQQGKRIFLLASVSRLALGPTQPPIQWAPGVKRGLGVMLTIHPHLVPRSRMSRSNTSSPSGASIACSGTDLLMSDTNIGVFFD
jgi:hypothetical protein